MRPAVVVGMLALVGTAVRLGVAGVAPSAAPAVPVEVPAAAKVDEAPSAAPVVLEAAPEPQPSIRELATPVPGDVKVEVHPDGEGGFRVTVRRKGHLVALRRLDAVRGGRDEVSLPVLHREVGDARLVWETTSLSSFETTRGVLRLDGEGTPRLVLSETPVPVPREERRLHRCWSYADGAGGSTVLCRIAALSAVANVTGPDRSEGVSIVPNVAGSLARIDLPAGPNAVEAGVLGYVDGNASVMIRAESSLLPGEARPSLTVLSAERVQPQVRPLPRFEGMKRLKM